MLFRLLRGASSPFTEEIVSKKARGQHEKTYGFFPKTQAFFLSFRPTCKKLRFLSRCYPRQGLPVSVGAAALHGKLLSCVGNCCPARETAVLCGSCCAAREAAGLRENRRPPRREEQTNCFPVSARRGKRSYKKAAPGLFGQTVRLLEETGPQPYPLPSDATISGALLIFVGNVMVISVPSPGSLSMRRLHSAP